MMARQRTTTIPKDRPDTATAAAVVLADGPRTDATPVPRRWHWLALLGVLLLAVGLRARGMATDGFWIDEFYSLEFSTGVGFADIALPRDRVIDPAPPLTQLAAARPAWSIWTSLGGDVHPPLYYLLLRLWRDAFGSSEWACRSLSLVASVAGIALLFDVGRVLFNPRVALWACALMAVAQAQIWYAQEARGYALVSALFLAAAAALARIERLGFGARRGAALFAGVLGAMLTHYYAAAGCVALGVYALLRLRRPARARTVLVMAGAAAVWLLVWGPFFLVQLHGIGSHETWLADPGPGFLGRWAQRLLLAPTRLLAKPDPGSYAAAGLLAVLLVVPFLLLRRRPALLLPALWAIAWIALPAVTDLARTQMALAQERYYLAAAPAFYLIAAALVESRGGAASRIPAWANHLLPGTLVLYCLLCLPSTYAPHKYDWRGFGRLVADHVRPGDILVCASPGFGAWYAGVEYLDCDYYAPGHVTRLVLLDGPASPATLGALRRAPAVWLARDFTATLPGSNAPDYLPGFTPGEGASVDLVGSLVRVRPAATPPPEGRP